MEPCSYLAVSETAGLIYIILISSDPAGGFTLFFSEPTAVPSFSLGSLGWEETIPAKMAMVSTSSMGVLSILICV